MRTYRLLSFLGLGLLTTTVSAQAPQGFSYQAVARDAFGTAVSGQIIGVQFVLHQGNALGAVIYAETHSTSTNTNGLFALTVGAGSSSVGSFNGIDWSTGPYFLEVAMDVSSSGSYTPIGTQQLMSVPYALYAGRSNIPDGTEVGQILHWTGTAWAADSGLYVADKRFGIGDTSPECPLGIKGEAGQDDQMISFSSTDAVQKWNINLNPTANDVDGFSIDDVSSGTGSSRLFIAPVTGNVGIGTTGPEAPLSIGSRDHLYAEFRNGDIPSGEDFRISTGGNTGLDIEQDTTGGYTSRLFIESATGHIGIGTNEPDAPLAIESRTILKTYFETGDIPTADNFGLTSDGTGFGIRQGTPDNLVGRLFIQSSTGNIGIGTDDPTAPLAIVSSTVLKSYFQTGVIPTQNDFAFTSSETTGFGIEQGTPSTLLSRFFIQGSTGFVGIGTITPEQKLHIESSTPSGITGMKILNTASTHNEGWKIGHIQTPAAPLAARDGAFVVVEDGVTPNERITILPGGNVGINELIPDTRLHISRVIAEPGAALDLIEGTGIMVLGPITKNIVADHRGIQARQGEHVGGLLNMTTSDLNLQRLGGDILIHGDMTVAPPSRGIITSDARLGLGTITPTEKIDIDGAIRIGTSTGANDGTIRYNGTDFEGRKGGAWASLTAGNGPWTLGTGNSVSYSPPTGGNVGINEVLPYATLHVSRPSSDPLSAISLNENTGIAVLGPILGQNLGFDSHQIQARTGSYLPGTTTLSMTASTLHLQPRGGVIVIHSDDAVLSNQVTVTADGKIGVGKDAIERMDVNGAITIGTSGSTTAADGTIRYTGTDFEGRTDNAWTSLGSNWEKVDNTDAIHYSTGTNPRVGIGTSTPTATLHVVSQDPPLGSDAAAFVGLIDSQINIVEDRYLLGLKVYSLSTTPGSAGSKNIGIYVSDVSGQSSAERNIAAVFNGNVVVGDITGQQIGTGGTNVLAIQNGAPPAAPSSGIPTNGVQIYSDDLSGVPTFHVMRADGSIIKLYRQAALTPADGSTVGPVYDPTTAALIENMRSRINDLELRLQNLGLITP